MPSKSVRCQGMLDASTNVDCNSGRFLAAGMFMTGSEAVLAMMQMADGLLRRAHGGLQAGARLGCGGFTVSKLNSVGFRKQQSGSNQHQISADREQSDGVPEIHRCAEISDQSREQRANGPARIE